MTPAIPELSGGSAVYDPEGRPVVRTADGDPAIVVADLDAGMQRSIDAYTDPWGQDAKQPATPGQFRPSLPLIALPKVPVR